MILLADNDINKLAQCDLLADLPELLGEAPEEILITPTARFQMMPRKRDKAIAKYGSEAAVERIKEFLDLAKEIPEIQNKTLLKALGNTDNIDEGEAMLFAAALELPSPILMTGDRNALRAVLANQDRLPTVNTALRERVVTFESAILLALHKQGFTIVKQKLLGWTKPDGLLRLVLKPNMNEADLSECLQSASREVEPLLLFRQIIFNSTKK